MNTIKIKNLILNDEESQPYHKNYLVMTKKTLIIFYANYKNKNNFSFGYQTYYKTPSFVVISFKRK